MCVLGDSAGVKPEPNRTSLDPATGNLGGRKIYQNNLEAVSQT